MDPNTSQTPPQHSHLYKFSLIISCFGIGVIISGILFFSYIKLTDDWTLIFTFPIVIGGGGVLFGIVLYILLKYVGSNIGKGIIATISLLFVLFFLYVISYNTILYRFDPIRIATQNYNNFYQDSNKYFTYSHTSRNLSEWKMFTDNQDNFTFRYVPLLHPFVIPNSPTKKTVFIMNEAYTGGHFQKQEDGYVFFTEIISSITRADDPVYFMDSKQTRQINTITYERTNCYLYTTLSNGKILRISVKKCEPYPVPLDDRNAVAVIETLTFKP